MLGCDFQIIDPPSGGGTAGLLADVENLAVSTVVGTPWQQKTRLSLLGLTPGDYRLLWSYNWNLDSTSKDFEARVELNDTTLVMSHVEEPTDATGNWNNTGSGQKLLETGVRRIALSGNVTLDLDWRGPDNRVATSIWNARLELWRIS